LNYLPGKLRLVTLFIGGLVLAVNICATLFPIGLRPHIPGFQADSERFLAYFAASALLVLAFPRQRLAALGAVIIIAVGLEWLQTLEVTRHGRAHDAVVKAAGATVGACFAMLCEYMLRRLLERKADRDESSRQTV